MSLGIYGATGVTILHTFVSTAPLQLLYFDGASATLTKAGTLDSQSALLRHQVDANPSNEYIYDETSRGHELCDLALELRVDGFMRMNAGFEALICDFSKSDLHEKHSSNVSVPGTAALRDNPGLPRDPNRRPPRGFGNTFAEEYGWDWIRSAASYYGGGNSGGGTAQEARVSLDLCGMISFYDPLLRSLAGKHTVHRDDIANIGWGLRRGHRLLDIDAVDAQRVSAWVKDVLRRLGPTPGSSTISSLQPDRKCSGINWQTITDLIISTHKGRALEISETLQEIDSASLPMHSAVDRIHRISHAALAPFFEYPDSVGQSYQEVKDQTIGQCSMLYTGHLDESAYNEFEALLKHSIETGRCFRGTGWRLFFSRIFFFRVLQPVLVLLDISLLNVYPIMEY